MHEVMSEALIRERTSNSGKFREFFENYFQHVLKNPSLNERENRKIEHTLINYFKRMQKKTTPF